MERSSATRKHRQKPKNSTKAREFRLVKVNIFSWLRKLEIDGSIYSSFVTLAPNFPIQFSFLKQSLMTFTKRKKISKKNSKASASLANFERYLHHSEINSYLIYLTQNYPNRCEVQFPGSSFEKRNICAIRISCNITKTIACEDRKIILIDGGTHARGIFRHQKQPKYL